MISLLRVIRGRNASAPVARERLQILLAHERGLRDQPELLELLRAEILSVVARHVVLDSQKIVVRMERGKQASTLEIDIELPTTSLALPISAVSLQIAVPLTPGLLGSCAGAGGKRRLSDQFTALSAQLLTPFSNPLRMLHSSLPWFLQNPGDHPRRRIQFFAGPSLRGKTGSPHVAAR